MKRNRFTILVGLLYLAVLPLWAQSSGAKDILDRTAETFRKDGGIKATFTFSSAEMGESEGTLYLKGDKFVLEAEGVKTWFDGKTQWSYMASTEEVNISTPTPEELQSLNPYVWLSLYKQGYELKLGTPSGGKNKTCHYVCLTATDKKKDPKALNLYVSHDTYHIKQIDLLPQGSRAMSVIIVKSYQTGLTYPDNFFTFDKKKYPKAEVIDLR
ncbi:MAG: LolA-like putative outer membrane lipoprotein chaperone [Bacteroides sp.]|nr:LolA-like putative outer membrane lipoprotein chaperone [Bacteroides sp.]